MKKILVAIVVLELSSIACRTQTQELKYATNPDVPFRAMHLSVGTHPAMVSTTDVNKDGNVDIPRREQ